MKITKVNLEGHQLVVYYLIDKYYLGLFLKDGPLRTQGSWPISYVADIKNITGENGILETLAGIKNVAVTKEEYEKLKKEHQEIMDNDYEGYDWDFPLCFDLENAYDNSIFTKEQLSQTYYTWSGGEMGWAESYSDITVCFDNFSDREEYYKTSEVLEVLEKWKEVLEKWSNPEEKKKMIEEFEKGEIKED